MNPSIPFEIDRRRRYIRATSKPRIGILGKADGTLYCENEPGKYWARWRGSVDANSNASQGQPFKVWAGDTNYIPTAGRQVYIGRGFNGELTIKGAVPSDLVNAGYDQRILNPNDPYNAYQYTDDLVTFLSVPLADEGNDTLKVNLNQLLYLDAYGNYNLWNGTDENTHLDMAVFEALLTVDQHCYGIVALKTLENDTQTVASTPISAFVPLTLDDVQEAKNKLDPEFIASRVYRIYYNQTTLIADPVTDWDLRQWVNVPPRLGNPTIITERLRVRAQHQLIYYGEVQVLGELHVLGEVILLGEPEAGGGTGAPVAATYITQTPHADLTNEQALSALATGLLKNTTGTGVLSIATAGTDYQAAPPLNYRSPSGLQLRKRDNDTLEVLPGAMEVNGVLVEKTALTVLAVATNGDWISGTAASANSEFIGVYADPSSNIKLHNKLPNVPSPAAAVATMLVNQATYNGTTGLGLNATSVIYDGDTGEGSITVGMLALIYASTDTDYSLGRGRGSAAAGSRNDVSAAIISAINTGTNTLTLVAGHNIAIFDNDRIAVVPYSAIQYRLESSVWWRLIGMMYNDASGNLDDTRQMDYAKYVANEAANYTTTASAFGDVDSTNLSFDILSTGKPLLVSFSGSATHGSGSGTIYFNLSLDAVDVYADSGAIHGLMVSASYTFPFGFSRVMLNLLPGTHRIRLRWHRGAAGTATLYAGAGTASHDDHPEMSVIEIG